MSKKQEPIISGIDVSECPIYDKKTGCYHTFDGKCVKDSYTVYKWLLEHKRLQVENEELKKKKDEYYLINLDYETKISYLIQALEEIREVLEYYANSWINPLQYPNLHYDSKKAKDALLKVNEVLNDRY